MHPWLIHVNVWQKPPQYCKVISLQLKLINLKKKKIWYVYTMEYSSIKKNEIMPFAATCVDLDHVILSKVSQTEKDKYHMTSLTCGI